MDCQDTNQHTLRYISFAYRFQLRNILPFISVFNFVFSETLQDNKFKSSVCSQWFLQPSYDTNHLLIDKDVKLANSASSNKVKVPPATNLVDEWKVANEYHFKSLASVELLRQIRLSFHTDFNLEQVGSFYLFTFTSNNNS